MSVDELLSDFLNIIEKIFELQEKKSIKENPIKKKFTNYKKCLEKTEASEHSDFFISPFKKNRIPILADKSDKWIREGNVFIQFNEGSKSENPKFRIMLSVIYKTALNFAKEAREEFDTLMGKEKLNLTEAYPQVKYPDHLLYTFYRLVHYFLSSCGQEDLQAPDIKKLDDIIKKYETHLQIKGPSGKTESGTSVNQTNIQTAINEVFSAPAVSNIFNAGMEVMKKNGMNPSPDFKAPSGEEISNMLQGLLGNPKVKGFLSSMMDTMQNSKTPDQLFSGLQKNFGNGEVLQDLISSVNPYQNQAQAPISSTQNQTFVPPVNEIVKDAVTVEENLISINEQSGNNGNPGNTPSKADELPIVTFD